MRAAISTDYYTRLEQGRERHPSVQVLDAIAAALELSVAEIAYLYELVIHRQVPQRGQARNHLVPNQFLVQVMHLWTAGPAYIVNHRSDVLALNQLAQEFHTRLDVSDNILRMLFLDPKARDTWVNWDAFASFIVSSIRRTGPGVYDDDPTATALMEELANRSPAFARLWGSHEIDVREHKEKIIRHRTLGAVQLDFELLAAIDTPKQFLILHRSEQQLHAAQNARHGPSEIAGDCTGADSPRK